MESLTARVQRYDGRIEAMAAAIAVVQQQAAALQRELERVATGHRRLRRSRDPASSRHAGTTTLRRARRRSRATRHRESWKYPAFEAAFRGSEDDVRSTADQLRPDLRGRQRRARHRLRPRRVSRAAARARHHARAASI